MRGLEEEIRQRLGRGFHAHRAHALFHLGEDVLALPQRQLQFPARDRIGERPRLRVRPRRYAAAPRLFSEDQGGGQQHSQSQHAA
jgi:hypothetical protein